ncbi:unnamed protein product [Ixodes hexagonus]
MHSCSVIVCHDKLLSSTVAAVVGIAAACVLWLGCLSGITVLVSFACGGIWMRLLKHGRVEVPDLWGDRSRRKASASRRRPVHEDDEYALFPWRSLKIPQEVDTALETLLDGVLREYVHVWYGQLSKDGEFVHELRVVLRHLLAALYRRVAAVDLVGFITGPVTRASLSHLDCYLRSRTVVSDVGDQGRFLLGCLGSQMHVAVGSREAELQYLRLLTEALLEHLLPARYLKCKSACTLLRELIGGTLLLKAMDLIAEPDIVNHLLLLFLDKTPMAYLPLDSSPPVEFLEHFEAATAPPRLPPRDLRPRDVQLLLKDDELRGPFVQFLREEGAGHLLDFYHALEDFHMLIINPELGPNDRLALHDQATAIFYDFMCEEAPHRVPLKPGTSAEVRAVLERGPEGIMELQTSSQLRHSHDDVYSILDEVFFPLFFESDRYFEVVCKARDLGKARKAQDRSMGTKSSTRAKLKKIRDVLRAPIDDGQDELGPTEVGEPAEEPVQRPAPPDARLRDLSAWRVSIPVVEMRVDMQHRHYPAFIVEVQRIDVGNGDSPDDLNWTVARRYHEFYVLEAKLLEFHGELPVAPLPPRRSPARQQLPPCRIALEKYLQDLLTVPPLRSSELLYSFLRLDAEEFTTSFLPDIRLGKMIRTVPMRLVKEKGQHLDPFLQTFLASTQPAPARPRPDFPDASKRQARVSKTPPQQHRIRQGPHMSPVLRLQQTVGSLYDLAVYLAEALFCVAPWLLRLLRALAPLLRRSVQGIMERYLSGKLEQALAPGRVVLLIELLGEAVLGENTLERTADQKRARAVRTHEEMGRFFPDFLVRLIGTRHHAVAVDALFQGLQQRLLNKQLSYVLLDLVVEEVFPEMRDRIA